MSILKRTKQSGQQSIQQKIRYEVCGLDTFAHEYYSCGYYNSRSEAEKVLEEHRKSVMNTQDEELRDEFWIREITDELIAEERDNENRIRNEKREELSYNSSHLADCVRELLQKFKTCWETADIKAISEEKNRNRKLEVNWQDEGDCFEQVHFETTYIKEKQELRVGIGVNIRSGKYFGGSITKMGQFSGTLEKMLEWADTEKALNDCVKVIQTLISNFDD